MSARLLACLFVAGGCGALSRFGLTTALGSVFGKGSPWGTAIVNLLGCLLFGAIVGLFAVKTRWDPQIKTIALTGFCGAFTTFSTYAFELHSLLKAREYGRACLDFLVQNVLGLGALALGLWLATALARRSL